LSPTIGKDGFVSYDYDPNLNDKKGKVTFPSKAETIKFDDQAYLTAFADASQETFFTDDFFSEAFDTEPDSFFTDF
jgi:hypothetical protein